MKKFRIQKQIGFAVAGAFTTGVLLFAAGVGLLMNQKSAEAVECTTGNDCSNLTVDKQIINNNGQTDIAADSEFQYTITVASKTGISQPVNVTDMLGQNVKYQRIQSVDFGDFPSQTVSTSLDGDNLELELPNGVQGSQAVTVTVVAKATQSSIYSATAVESSAYVYSSGDSQCNSLSSAQNYAYSNCTSTLSFNILSAQLQIDKTIDSNYNSYEDIHTGEEFLYTLTVTNTAVGSYARDTITVYDEISPHLSNVRIVKIIYFNKMLVGFDDNNNAVNANPPLCMISSQNMKCVFNALLYDETTSGDQILIQVAATPSAQYTVTDADSYTIKNEAFVYSQSDSYCKTLANAQEDLDANNTNYIGISDGNNSLRSRCRSAIEFGVVQPQLGIRKTVSDDGKVWCTYKDAGWAGPSEIIDEFGNVTYKPGDHIITKDITDAPDKAAACLNEYSTTRPPNNEEIWAAYQVALSEGKIGQGSMYADYAAFAAAYKANPDNHIEQDPTPGEIEDNSIHNGETLIYTLFITNTGSGETKGDIVITDQLDKNAFSDAGIAVQPLTGGVDCSVKDALVKCVIKRSLGNETGTNEIIIQISATVEASGTLYNTAYVGGGGDLKCPVSKGDRMWCKSNEVSTYVSSPELHINKELRVDEKDCPTTGTGEEGAETASNDADPCWSLGSVIVNGSWAKYVIKVTNEGTADTSGLIVIHDQIPDYLEVDRTTLALKFDDETYNYDNGLCEFRGTANRDLYCRAYDTLNEGLKARNGSWTIEFNARVLQDVNINKDNNKIVNYAYVYGGGDVVCTNETIELSVKEAFENGTNSPLDRCYDYLGSTIVSPKLKVTKTINSGQVQAGQPFKYKISVDNIGDHDVPFGTTMIDILPEGITIDTTALPGGCEYNDASRRITCNINEKIAQDRPMIFEITANTTNATGTIVNKVLAYNKYDKDCQTELAANYTSRCHDIAAAQSMSPVLKVNMYTNVLDTYVGGQVEYRIAAKNIGNMPTTATTTINQAIPEGLKILGVRAQKGVCWPSATEIKCEIPTGVKAGETVNISVLTQVTTEGDIVSDVNLYDGGDSGCSVDGTESSNNTSLLFSTPVFAADTNTGTNTNTDPGANTGAGTGTTTPSDVSDGTTGDNTSSGDTTNNDGATDTNDSTDGAVNSNDTTNTGTTGDGSAATTAPPASSESTTPERNTRCQSSVTIRASASPNAALGINDTGVGSPMAGALNLLQAVGTISLLGAASYGLLKFGFIASPAKV